MVSSSAVGPERNVEQTERQVRRRNLKGKDRDILVRRLNPIRDPSRSAFSGTQPDRGRPGGGDERPEYG